MRGSERRSAALFAIAAAGITGCGSSSTVIGTPPSPGHATAALQHAGWKVTQAAGMPQTLTGARQLFYLQTVAPDGAQISLQFFTSSAKAAGEAADIKRMQHMSDVATVDDAIAIAAGSSPLEPADVSALRRLLRS